MRRRDFPPGAAGLAQATTMVSLALAAHALAAAPAPVETPAPAAVPSAGEFADLAHYAAANRALPRADPAHPRVVFMGDSITQSWGDLQAGYFTRPDRLNRGISGQTTPQMLLRFRQDVIELQPAVVHLLAGTNDIAGNAGTIDAGTTEGNIASMVDLALANHIRVVLASVLPTTDYPWRRGLEPGAKIAALNHWLKRYARERHLVFVDYYAALTDGALGIRPSFAPDGVHPSLAGYEVMLPLAEAGIAAALRATKSRR